MRTPGQTKSARHAGLWSRTCKVGISVEDSRIKFAEVGISAEDKQIKPAETGDFSRNTELISQGYGFFFVPK